MTDSLPETQRIRRGHAFYPPASLKVPALYATEDTPAEYKFIRVRYFVGACQWWGVEFDPEEGIMFGYACLGDPHCAEWGTTSLVELEAIKLHGGLAVVERDLHWSPMPASEANLPGRWH